MLVPVIGTELGAVGLDGREADLLRGAYNTELGVVGRVGNGAGCVLISWFLSFFCLSVFRSLFRRSFIISTTAREVDAVTLPIADGRFPLL